MKRVTLGGDRLHMGNKVKVGINSYERANFDLDEVFRSTMSAGTIVPFYQNIGLTGDSFDFKLFMDAKSLPTNGPLFGSYEVCADMFVTPLRIFLPKLQMNMLKVGLDMSTVKFPVMKMRATTPPAIGDIDNWQINPSSIFKYLGISGLGFRGQDISSSYNWEVVRNFSALGYLNYFETCKQYFCNKQEEKAYIIHDDLLVNDITIAETQGVMVTTGAWTGELAESITPLTDVPTPWIQEDFKLVIHYTALTEFNAEGWYMGINGSNRKMVDIFSTWSNDSINGYITFANPYAFGTGEVAYDLGNYWYSTEASPSNNTIPKLTPFDLENIDKMRMYLMQQVGSNVATVINNADLEPYTLPFHQVGNETDPYSAKYSKNSAQEGLMVKTYKADMFNNWMNTEWIDGTNGVNEVTAIDVSDGLLRIDSLNIAMKVYKMLNAVSISGGSYDDWQEVVYDHKRIAAPNNPMFVGGMSRNMWFEEIISQTATDMQPLGTLAGRGQLEQNGPQNVYVKCDEACLIMGLTHITPRIDYSQGNAWYNNLENMDDLHKPALDQIGFQDSITDQRAWFDTPLQPPYDQPMTPLYKSAGKVPAWLNYMTSHNKVYGDFAIRSSEMFQVLNRRFDVEFTGENATYNQPLTAIKDLTSYIDPSKFNFIFADTKLNAMNFWVQIDIKVNARRKMSAKVMPNL